VPRLAIARTFLTSYANLEKTVRKSVDATINKFEHHTHAGLHLEKLEQARDPRVRTIRIDKFWRGVVLAPDTGDVYCLLAVLPHDAAIKYATSREFTVNQRLGVLEVRDAGALEQLAPALGAMAEGASRRLFHGISDHDFVHLGVDADVLPIVRLLTTEDHLAALENMLPEPQYLALIALAHGMTVEQAWAEICQLLPDAPSPERVDTSDLVAAMERTPGEITFVSGPAELAQILEHPFAAWRVFLHPAQRRLAYRESFSGPVQVTGGAGTGKTVTALHRARHLAERGGGVLVTTFTKTLAEALSRQLDLLIDDPAVRGRVEVINVDKLAYQILQESTGHHLKVIGDGELQAFWNTATAQAEVPFTPTFLQREWEQVILAQNLRDRASYLACVRHGQGRQLAADQREQVWSAVSRFLDIMRQAGYLTHTQIAAAAADTLAKHPDRPYRHVIVDEAQDLHPAKWRMLRAAVPEGPDDLFIVGDPHQRIYDNKVSLRSLGIRVSGRSYRLKLSYRTTAEILNWSVRLLGVEPVVGLDDAADSLAGYQSSLHGRRPIVRACQGRADELEALTDQVRKWLDDGVEPHAIGVAARFGNRAAQAEQALQSAGIRTSSLSASDSAYDSVRVGTMHRMKGLEFRCVAVISVDDNAVPAPGAVTAEADDPVAHDHDLQRERCLLFVACTRARDTLYISHTGSPSSFLPG